MRVMYLTWGCMLCCLLAVLYAVLPMLPVVPALNVVWCVLVLPVLRVVCCVNCSQCGMVCSCVTCSPCCILCYLISVLFSVLPVLPALNVVLCVPMLPVLLVVCSVTCSQCGIVCSCVTCSPCCMPGYLLSVRYDVLSVVSVSNDRQQFEIFMARQTVRSIDNMHCQKPCKGVCGRMGSSVVNVKWCFTCSLFLLQFHLFI